MQDGGKLTFNSVRFHGCFPNEEPSVGLLLGQTGWFQFHDNCSSSALASFSSAVSNPSVNQP